MDATGIGGCSEKGVAQQSSSGGEFFILPNDHKPITESAREIFAAIAPTHTLFIRGKVVMELVKAADGYTLDLLRPDGFRSRLENYGRKLAAWRVDEVGGLVLRPKICPEDTAKALLATREATELLPSVNLLTRSPVIVGVDDSIEVLSQGYHSHNGGLLVTGGETPLDVPLSKAVEDLLWLVAEFDFQTPGDQARALAAFVTPALKMGGFLRDAIPLDVAEADSSQSGKTYRQKLVRAIYREIAYPIGCKNGGVGSLDESLSAALLSGRPFVAIDNLRGKLDSQFLEMVVTWGGSVAARVPHRGEVMVDASRVTFQLTSNGVETTRDLANRSSIVRIRKRHGYKFRLHPEGDLLAHVEARQSHYLGCVFAIAREWVRQGRRMSDDTRHDFREWAGTLDWICQYIFQTCPLLDGHQRAQERTSNPSLTWLRRVALAVAAADKLGEEFSASNIYGLCEEEGIEIPTLRHADEDKGRKVVGSIMAKCFREAEEIEVDHLRVKRCEREEYMPERQAYRKVKRYSFRSVHHTYHTNT